MSNLHIGIDIDNTLTFGDPVWRKHMQETAEACGHRPVGDSEVQTHWDYWREICVPCWKRALYEPSILKTHCLLPDAKSVLLDLHAKGIEFSIVTGRPEATRETTQRWLEDEFGKDLYYTIFSGLYFSEVKWDVCLEHGITWMVDDSPRVIEGLEKHNISTILMVREHNIDYVFNKKPQNCAYSWLDVERFLTLVSEKAS